MSPRLAVSEAAALPAEGQLAEVQLAEVQWVVRETARQNQTSERQMVEEDHQMEASMEADLLAAIQTIRRNSGEEDRGELLILRRELSCAEV